MYVLPADSCPSPDMLQTGDLLFPRLPKSDVVFLAPFNADKLKLGKTVNFTGIPKIARSQVWSADGLGDWANASIAHVEQAYDRDNAHFSNNAAISEAMMVWKAMKLKALGSIEALAGSSLAEFMDDPLVILFRVGLGGPLGDIHFTSFEGSIGKYYIGHVAMVVRKGEEVFVIEANASDYSHYRVALHPYFCDDEDPNTLLDPHSEQLQRMRGWCNRRLAIGETVWAARPMKQDDPGSPPRSLNNDERAAVEVAAKLMLGRPYDMFDSVRLGDDDRLYCGEFIYLALLNGASLDTSDQATWSWVVSRLLELLIPPVAVAAALEQFLKDELQNADISLNSKFPWLTPKMLYHSQYLDTGLYRPEPGRLPYA
jgi:hypothetical protein